MPTASVPVSAALTGSLGKRWITDTDTFRGDLHLRRRYRALQPAPIEDAHMSVVSRLRQVAEDEIDAVIAQGRSEFPITSPTAVSGIIGAWFGAPVSTADVRDALKGAYVSFPIRDRAALIEVCHRIIDLRFGDGK